jgi:hypothetical protein
MWIIIMLQVTKNLLATLIKGSIHLIRFIFCILI